MHFVKHDAGAHTGSAYLAQQFWQKKRQAERVKSVWDVLEYEPVRADCSHQIQNNRDRIRTPPLHNGMHSRIERSGNLRLFAANDMHRLSLPREFAREEKCVVANAINDGREAVG